MCIQMMYVQILLLFTWGDVHHRYPGPIPASNFEIYQRKGLIGYISKASYDLELIGFEEHLRVYRETTYLD